MSKSRKGWLLRALFLPGLMATLNIAATADDASGEHPKRLPRQSTTEAAAAAYDPSCAPTDAARDALEELARGGFAIAEPETRQRRALELAECLGDPDPKIRDGIAFQALQTWLRGDAIDTATRLALAERLLPMIEADDDAAGFRRPFAALALAEVARADRLSPSLANEVRQRIVIAAAQYLGNIRDYRGYDANDGWRHAVAHAADLILQIGLHPATSESETSALMDAIAQQVAPAVVAYVHGEPERLARAVYFVRGRGVLDDAFWDSWFERIGSLLKDVGDANPQALDKYLVRRHNLLAFLHAVAFAARANPGPASDRLAEVVHRELLRVHAQ